MDNINIPPAPEAHLIRLTVVMNARLITISCKHQWQNIHVLWVVTGSKFVGKTQTHTRIDDNHKNIIP